MSQLMKMEILVPQYHKVNGFANFNSPELRLWQLNNEFDKPINFQNKRIVEGKKVGNSLGIPTANIEIDY